MGVYLGSNSVNIYYKNSKVLPIFLPLRVNNFTFVVSGDEYCIRFLAGEIVNCTISWGDNSKNTNIRETSSQFGTEYYHTYSHNGEWKITLKNYVSGWITFFSPTDDSNNEKLIRILTPLPKMINRTSFDECCRSCVNLNYVPNDLFINNIQGESFKHCFFNCTNLHFYPNNEIPWI